MQEQEATTPASPALEPAPSESSALDAAFPEDDPERPLASDKAGELLEDFTAANAGEPLPPRVHETAGRPRTRTRRRKKGRATERALKPKPEPAAEPEPELEPEEPLAAKFTEEWRQNKAKPLAKLGKLIYRLWGRDKELSDDDAREWGESAAECLAELGGMSERMAKIVDASDKFTKPAVFVGLNVALIDERLEQDKVNHAERAEATVVGSLPRSSGAGT